MSMKITQIEGNQFKAEYKGVEVISGNISSNSQYVGMSPGSLMVAALGMCTGMHVRNYLDKNNIEHSGIEISIKNKYERNPTRVVEFTLSVSIDGELTDEQKIGVTEEAKLCYVGNTMRGGPIINVIMEEETESNS